MNKRKRTPDLDLIAKNLVELHSIITITEFYSETGKAHPDVYKTRDTIIKEIAHELEKKGYQLPPLFSVFNYVRKGRGARTKHLRNDVGADGVLEEQRENERLREQVQVLKEALQEIASEYTVGFTKKEIAREALAKLGGDDADTNT